MKNMGKVETVKKKKYSFQKLLLRIIFYHIRTTHSPCSLSYLIEIRDDLNLV